MGEAAGEGRAEREKEEKMLFLLAGGGGATGVGDGTSGRLLCGGTAAGCDTDMAAGWKRVVLLSDVVQAAFQQRLDHPVSD